MSSSYELISGDGATFDDDPTRAMYRYRLWRALPSESPPKTCLFVMLNPSTADHLAPDPTITRCRGFAEREGCSKLEVVNLFAFRATIAEQLKTFKGDIVGPENDMETLEAAMAADLVICAWGTKVPKAHVDRVRKVMGILRGLGQCPKLYCLGTTRGGHPKHPLYLAATTPLEIFAP